VQKVENFKDNPMYKFGHEAELQIEDLLKSHGAYIIPSYDYSGDDEKAPRLCGVYNTYVVPDLDVSFGKRIWVEVKRKTERNKHYKTGHMVHGIPIRHFNDYRSVEKITGCKVWIVFVDRIDILCGELFSLKINHTYLGEKMSKGGMIFFNVTDLYPIDILINVLKNITIQKEKENNRSLSLWGIICD
jgi:hypothetical protein